MKNIAKNFFYQSLFQLTKIILPIITIPIVSNALGPSGIGLYNYTFSIVQYFVLFAGLGVTMYGNREITLTYNRKKEALSEVFWEILLFKALASLIVIVAYFIVASLLNNRSYLFVQSLAIFAVLFNVSSSFLIKKRMRKNVTSWTTKLAILVFLKSSIPIKNQDTSNNTAKIAKDWV